VPQLSCQQLAFKGREWDAHTVLPTFDYIWHHIVSIAASVKPATAAAAHVALAKPAL